MPLPPPTPEEALRDFQEEILLRNAKWDDAGLVPKREMCLRLGVFATAQQRLLDAIAFEADKPSTLPGAPAWANYREHFNLLVEEAAHTLAGVTEPDKIEEFRLYGDPAEPGKFSTAERRAVKELMKWLLLKGLDDLFKRLTARSVWSLGDYKRLGDLTQANSTQGIVRSALETGGEIKDDKIRDLGVEGPWKNEWASIRDYAETFKGNLSKIWPVRAAQKSARTHEDDENLHKKADSAKLETSSFVPEDEAIGSRLARFALAHRDITEYARLSPNWHGPTGWVRIPEGLTPSQLAHVQVRINRLAADPETAAFATDAHRTIQEIAVMREVFFRPKPLVDALSGGLIIRWEDVWDNLGNGPVLIDLLIAPSGLNQSASMAARTADRMARGLLGAQPEIAGKWGPRISTVAVFLTTLGFVMVMGIQLGWSGKEAYALIAGFIAAIAFDQWVVLALKQRNERPIYIAAGAILVLALVVVLLGNWQHASVIDPQRNQQWINIRQGLGSYH